MDYSAVNSPIEESGHEVEPVSQEISIRSALPSFSNKYFYLEMSLHLLSMASYFAVVVLMRIAPQIEVLTNPCTGLVMFQPAVIWWHSPTFIYFVAALSLAISYCASSGLSTIWRRRGLWPWPSSNEISIRNALFHPLTFITMSIAIGHTYLDVYIGLKGIKYIGWETICCLYDESCRHKYDGTPIVTWILVYQMLVGVLFLVIGLIYLKKAITLHRQLKLIKIS